MLTTGRLLVDSVLIHPTRSVTATHGPSTSTSLAASCTTAPAAVVRSTRPTACLGR